MFIMNVSFTGSDSAVGGNDPLVGVRSIEPRDAPAVTVLIQQLGYNRPEAEVLRWIEDVGSSSHRQAAFVACLHDEVIGWIEVSIEHRLQSAPFALIGGLVVNDGVRGKGIGRHLCRAAESWSWDRGVSIVRVTSRSTRTDAHRFYLNDGYESVKVSQVFEKRRQE
jgi:GNAT superfamily N-acetyltransferase